ncbi:hypothetical protein MBLNU457_g2529t1 [Dothideomycetes sp. NU457]
MDLLQSLILPNTGSVQTQLPAQLLQQAIDAATPELKQLLLRSLAVLCNATGFAVPARSVPHIAESAVVSPPEATIPQLCGFWYHYGDCRRDPSSPTYNGSKKLCPYLHHIEPGMEDVMSSKAAAKGIGAEMRGQKRMRSEVEERDRPETVSEPRSRNVAASVETCFFWYHGDCRRMRDNGRCDHLHALTSPPSMVKDPPSYVHRQTCTLEWCPGDSSHEKVETLKKSVKKQKKYHIHADNPAAMGHKQIMDRLLYSDGSDRLEAEAGAAAAAGGRTGHDEEEGEDNDDSTWFLSGFPDTA